MNKIKVLHIIKTLNLGGAETNLANLIPAFPQNLVDNHVAYSVGGAIESRFKGKGIKLFKFAEKDYKVKSFASLWIIFKLVRYIQKNGIQVIHTHTFTAHAWGAIAAKITGIKLVEHVHDYRYLDPRDIANRKGGVIRQYKYARFFKNMSDMVIVLTKQNKEYLLNNKYYSDDKIAEIKNGIDSDSKGNTAIDANILKAKYFVKSGDRIVFTSARIDSMKNIDLLYDIACEVCRIRKDVVFIIAGDGPLLEKYRTAAIRSGVGSKIRFIGFQDDIIPLLSISDLYFLPSFLELHSIAILEAMSMKIPVIISENTGSNNEFIRNWENGVLLDPFKKEGWSSAICKLLDDDFTRDRIGLNGYETCKKEFDINSVALKICDVYRKILCKNS